MGHRSLAQQRFTALVAFGCLLGTLTGCQSLFSFGKTTPPPPPSSNPVTSIPASPLRNDQKTEVQLAVAKSLEERGELAEAMRVYQGILERERPRWFGKSTLRGAAVHRLAVLHDRQRSYATAQPYWDEAAKIAPDLAAVHCDRGYSSYVRGQWSEAEQQLRKAVELQPNSPRAHNNLALVLARSGRIDAAAQEFVQGGCTEAQARSNIGYLLLVSEQWQAAEGQFRAALALNPQLNTAQAGLATLAKTSRPIPLATAH